MLKKEASKKTPRHFQRQDRSHSHRARPRHLRRPETGVRSGSAVEGDLGLRYVYTSSISGEFPVPGPSERDATQRISTKKNDGNRSKFVS